MPFFVDELHLLGRSETGENRHHARNGLGFPLLDVIEHTVAEIHELSGPRDIDILCPANGDCLDAFVAHHRADAQAARARATLLDRSEKDPVLTSKSDGRNLNVGIFQFLSNAFSGLDGSFTAQMRGIANFDLVIVDPEINEVGRFATNDHPVVARIFQLRRPESAHHRIGHQASLGRIGRDNGAVGAGSRGAAEEAGAEN